MNKIITKEELYDCIGEELPSSGWLEVGQVMIDAFADVTHDHQFIHVDQQKASETPFGSTVAHGFLTLSMLSYFAETGFGINIENSKMSLNYGFDKVRFLSPVKVGTRIRGRASLISVDEKSTGQLLLKQQVVIDIENEKKPALLADWLAMYIF